MKARRTIGSFRQRDVHVTFSGPLEDDDGLMDEIERRQFPNFWAAKQEDKKALAVGRKHLAKVNKKTSPHIDRAIYEAVERLLRGKKKLTKDAAFQHVVKMFAKGGHSLSVSTVRRAWQRGRPVRR
jgi:hypothetical protein